MLEDEGRNLLSCDSQGILSQRWEFCSVGLGT